MSILHKRIIPAASLASMLGVAAVLGMSAGPLAAAPLGTMMTAPVSPASSGIQLVAAKHAASAQESIDERISSLHKRLQITPDEDAKWNDVANAMRQNAETMEKLVAGLDTSPGITAVQDLKNYEQVTQAHVDGLKNLISAFSSLYDSMPDSQKKVADQVFQSFGHKPQMHARN